MRARCGAAGAFGQRRRPPGDAHGTQQIRIQYQVAGSSTVGHRPQRADRESMQSRGRCSFLTGEALGGFQHRTRAGVSAVVADDIGGERVKRDDLRDDVQVAARVQLHVDMRERLQSRAELAAGAAHSLGHRADQSIVAGEQGDDPVGFAELVLAQHHRPVPVQPHHTSVALRHGPVPEGTGLWRVPCNFEPAVGLAASFAWLSHARRTVRDYERLPEHPEAQIT